VLDYDYNAPNAEYLRNTHYVLYDEIRRENPNAPIVFMSKPDFDYDAESAERRDVILETYKKLDNAISELTCIENEHYYTEGFRFGFLMAMDIFEI
jgi:hypothetical protein